MHAEKDGNGLIIRKYTVNDDRDVSEAFRHMAAVFSYYAFGRMPLRIEQYAVLDGAVQSWRPDAAAVCASVDYLQLLFSSYKDGDGTRNSGDAAECRSCPLRGDCQQDALMASDARPLGAAALVM